MFKATDLIRGKIYSYRGEQIKFSHQSYNQRFFFVNSSGRRLMFTSDIIRRELYEIKVLAEQ
ncbi:hypothetical protein [Nostoc sp. FACHB-133]|uniref:hypothetical protein n=1 Tax=Nostoc sp. FACHB-133 TaxID=2692835 RepID=UPI00168317AD|nr:hypothetical protein [Nostoc sp. FACHB-133]MBD2525404.1 hypothetical protein [Nostoc sp. FACHB-133]